MKDLLVPIDLAGRIVLPKKVRQELALKPGDQLKLGIQGTAVTLTPASERGGLVRKGKALVFSTGGAQSLDAQQVEELLAECRESRSEPILTSVARRRQGR